MSVSLSVPTYLPTLLTTFFIFIVKVVALYEGPLSPMINQANVINPYVAVRFDFFFGIIYFEREAKLYKISRSSVS